MIALNGFRPMGDWRVGEVGEEREEERDVVCKDGGGGLASRERFGGRSGGGEEGQGGKGAGGQEVTRIQQKETKETHPQRQTISPPLHLHH